MVLIIKLKDVRKEYEVGSEVIHALRGVSLKIDNGEFISVMGPSGSGKTTLLNMIGVLDRPTSGKVVIGDDDTSVLSDRTMSKMRLNNFGFVFQQFYLIPTLSALENVYLPMKEAGMSRRDARKRAMELLELVSVEKRWRHLPHQMSGGEQQRIAIARAMANDPDTILADEPTGELDSDNSSAIMNIFKDLNRNLKKSIIIVTHDPEIAKRARKTIKMKDGRIH
ncbi:MAG: ABC transporter ATP-binding protein [Thermoplasmatota archaeon]